MPATIGLLVSHALNIIYNLPIIEWSRQNENKLKSWQAIFQWNFITHDLWINLSSSYHDKDDKFERNK